MAADERIRIAVLVPSLRGGGLERVTADLVLKLDHRRYHVHVFCLDGLGVHAARLSQRGVQVTLCRESALRIRGMPLKLLWHLHRFRPRIIHAHSGTWYPAAVAQALLRRPRLLFTDHGRYHPEPPRRAIVERWCYSRTARSVAVSPELADYIRRFLRLRRRPEVVPNGVEMAAFQRPNSARARLRKEWGVADGAIVAIAVGRLALVKNHATLLRAFALAAASIDNLALAIAGSGDLETELLELRDALGLQHRVRFLGFRDDIATCLQASDIFVIASRSEGLPISLLEALATGIPILSTRVGGIPDALGDPPAGLLVPADDVDRLAEGLVKLAKDRAIAMCYGSRGRERARHFALDTMVFRYARIYEEMLNGSTHDRRNRA